MLSMRIPIHVMITAALVASALIASVAAQRADPAAALFIRNGSVIDATGAPLRPRTDVAIQDGVITAVGPNLQPPANARIVDATGKFVMPGLIDAHAHLDAVMLFQLTPEQRTAILEHNRSAFLYNGVTTVLNVSSDADWIWKLRDDERAGRLVSPRIYAMGRAFTPEGGWGSRHGGALTSADDVRAQARDYIAHHTDGFKVMIEGGLGNSATYRVMPDDLLQALDVEARSAGVPVYVHAMERVAYRKALTVHPRAIVHGLDDGLPPGDTLLADLRANHVAVVPTISLIEAFIRFDGNTRYLDDPVLRASVPSFILDNLRRADFVKTERAKFLEVARMDAYDWARRALPILKENTRRMHEAGITLGVGTDAGGPVGYNFQGYNTPREVELLVECGLSPMDALIAATRNGAEIIGVDRQLGTVQAGKLADVIILSANPLADIRNIRRIVTVVQKGIVFPRDRFASGRTLPSVH